MSAADEDICGAGGYMYGNEEAVGEGVRKGMEKYGIPREEIYVITKINPNQFDDPEAAIDMALKKLI